MYTGDSTALLKWALLKMPSDVQSLNLDLFYMEFFRVLEEGGKKKPALLWSSMLDSKKAAVF